MSFAQKNSTKSRAFADRAVFRIIAFGKPDAAFDKSFGSFLGRQGIILNLWNQPQTLPGILKGANQFVHGFTEHGIEVLKHKLASGQAHRKECLFEPGKILHKPVPHRSLISYAREVPNGFLDDFPRIKRGYGGENVRDAENAVVVWQSIGM